MQKERISQMQQEPMLQELINLVRMFQERISQMPQEPMQQELIQKAQLLLDDILKMQKEQRQQEEKQIELNHQELRTQVQMLKKERLRQIPGYQQEQLPQRQKTRKTRKTRPTRPTRHERMLQKQMQQNA
jgi:hypothetical protein